MPVQNTNSIYPGVICSGIGNINQSFGFNQTNNTFALIKGILRFPDVTSNQAPYNVTNQTNLISVFVAFDNYTLTLPTGLTAGTYYAIATYQVNNDVTNIRFSYSPANIPYSIIATSSFTPALSAMNVALFKFTLAVSGSTYTVSNIITDINCCANYDPTLNRNPPVLFQQGRLGLVSGNPYQDNKYSSTLYFSPTKDGNLISLYNPSAGSWETKVFSETTLNINSLNPNTIYDIYIGEALNGNDNINMANITIITQAWNNNTPPNRINLNGKLVNQNNLSQLFVGSIYVQAVTTTDVNVTNYAQTGILMHPNNFYVYQYSNITATNQTIKLYKRDNQGGLTYISDQANAHNRSDALIVSGTFSGGVQNILYYIYLDGAQIAGCIINNDGTFASNTQVATVTTGTYSLASLTTSNAQYLYATNTTNNNVFQFRINNDGTLTALTPATVPTGSFPIGIKIITIGTASYAYVCNNADSTVTKFTIANGVLGNPTTVNTPGIRNYEIEISPDNLFAYVVGYITGGSGLIAFNINQTDGTLTNPITYPTAGGDTIIISNDGKYLYVGDNTISTLLQFSRNISTGALTALTSPSVTLENNFIDMAKSIDGQNIYVLDNSTSTTSVIETFFNWNGGLLQKTFNSFSSWKGQRYLYNYYNQVRLLMQGYIYNGGQAWKTASTVPTTSILMYPQNNDISYGAGRIGMLIDPTMQNFELAITGAVDSDNSLGSARRYLSIGLDNNNSIFNIGRNSVGGLVFLGSTTATSNTINGYTIPVGLEVPVDINNFQNPFGGGVPNNIYGVHYFQRLEGSDSNGTIFYENNGLSTFIFA